MQHFQNQGELFISLHELGGKQKAKEIEISTSSIRTWQKRIFSHQSNLLNGERSTYEQVSLFEVDTEKEISSFKPLELTPLSLNFWRWPNSPHSGPAIYAVMDNLRNGAYILLYIGETISANNRWKGEHDCKQYLESYCESLVKAGLKSQLSIRFWTDVPKDTSRRRDLEQQLIQSWLPPFNKETRSRWSTPFTAHTN